MRKLLEECSAYLSREIARFPWEQRDAYADWLAQTYYYVCHSTRLLASAASHFAMDERGNALHYRFTAHISEEKRHEALALHDLKQLGMDIRSLPERHSTRMFYETQYFKIERLAPISLFGYILPLEAIGPLSGKVVLDRITGSFGPKCVAFLKLHSEDDVEHLERAFKALEGISADEQRIVEQNIRQTSFAYGALLSEICSERGAQQR